MIRKYYIQILIFLCMAVNQVSVIWEDDLSLYRSISGKDGHPMYYFMWCLLDHYLHIIMALTGMYLLIKYPPDDKEFAIHTVLTSLIVICVEVLVYLYHGNSDWNERFYYFYLMFFTGSLIFYKIWNLLGAR